MPKGMGYGKKRGKGKLTKKGKKSIEEAKKTIEKIAKKVGKKDDMTPTTMKVYGKEKKPGKVTYYAPKTGEATTEGPVKGRKVLRKGMEKRTKEKAREMLQIRRMEAEKGVAEKIKSGFSKIKNYEE
ncbi:MAG: hypothetical protein GY699_09555 [Desulfobacteraceae bacterium]|nr:hypothetical protein [Desulfobacteraceae bacterium]